LISQVSYHSVSEAEIDELLISCYIQTRDVTFFQKSDPCGKDLEEILLEIRPELACEVADFGQNVWRRQNICKLTKQSIQQVEIVFRENGRPFELRYLASLEGPDKVEKQQVGIHQNAGFLMPLDQ
jgi:hypothetical protein